jgi:hypothetical protein
MRGAEDPVTLPRTTFVLALLALLPAATCASGAYRMPPSAQSKRTDAIAIPAGTKRLEVQFHDGLFAIEHADVASCDIETNLQADDAASLADYEQASAPVVEHRANDGVLTIRVALPPGARMDAVRSAWRVKAPRNLAVHVATRCGAVVARGYQGELLVDGGSGVIEATMNGGSASLSTTSGSLILRGDYARASVRSAIGRIDLALPPSRMLQGLRVSRSASCSPAAPCRRFLLYYDMINALIYVRRLQDQVPSQFLAMRAWSS